MHAYNIGIVKYDYKILLVVTKILAKEIKHLFVKKEGQVESSPQKVCQRNLVKNLWKLKLVLKMDEVHINPTVNQP